MSTSGARRAGGREIEQRGERDIGEHEQGWTESRDREEAKPRRSLAQWFCLVVGLALLLGGILGMLTADNNFDTAASDPDGILQGDGFLGFEVNGWHNLVHIVSGAVLLLGFARHGLARTLAIAFGVVYAVLLVLGLVNGNDILGFVPVNIADNVLHGVLALLGLGAGLLSTQKRREETRPSRQLSGESHARAEREIRVERERSVDGQGGGRREVIALADGSGVEDGRHRPRSR